MYILKRVLTIITLFHLTLLYSQDHDAEAERNELWPHSLGIMVGYAWVPAAVSEPGEA